MGTILISSQWNMLGTANECSWQRLCQGALTLCCAIVWTGGLNGSYYGSEFGYEQEVASCVAASGILSVSWLEVFFKVTLPLLKYTCSFKKCFMTLYMTFPSQYLYFLCLLRTMQCPYTSIFCQAKKAVFSPQDFNSPSQQLFWYKFIFLEYR